MFAVSAHPSAWAEVTVTLPATAPAAGGIEPVEALSALLLSLGAAGLQEEDGRLLAYFPHDAALGGRVEAATAHAARLLGEGAAVAARPLPDVDYVEAWKRGVRATPVAPGIVVAPTWDPYVERPGEVVIRLDPGMAFGTGAHGSTRLCLGVLAARRPSGPVLDLGTGSGILAIAAARLGARRVVAADIDPVATQVARDNVALNRVEDRVEVVTGGIDLVAGRFDAIVANILAGPLLEMAGAVAARLAPRGLVVLAGLLAREAGRVAAAYAAHGLREVERRLERESEALEWAALVMEH